MTYRFTYYIRFTAGTLKGLETTIAINWPQDSAVREQRRVQQQIANRHEFEGLGGSNYVITDYFLEQIGVIRYGSW